MNLEPTEKSSSPPPPPPPLPPSSLPSFSSLPDEITVNYLARISRSYYPRLSILSRNFRSLTSSTQLYAARSLLGNTEQCLYFSLSDPSNQSAKWFTLWINPNPVEQRKKKTTPGQLLVRVPSPNLPPLSRSVVSAGSEIYVIGPSSAVRILDCGSHTWRDGPRMKVARKDAVACVHDGKIYVLGGCEEKDGESWGEVFDTKTQAWESLPHPGTEIPKHAIDKIAEMDEKVILRDVKHNTYGYDPRKSKWGSCENITSMTDCVSENVSYVYRNVIGRWQLWWSQSNVKDSLSWRDVKGLESLGDKYTRSGGSGKNKLVSCGGGKFFLVWEAVKLDEKKIWCAEIVLEKRHGGVVKQYNKIIDNPMQFSPRERESGNQSLEDDH